MLIFIMSIILVVPIVLAIFYVGKLFFFLGPVTCVLLYVGCSVFFEMRADYNPINSANFSQDMTIKKTVFLKRFISGNMPAPPKITSEVFKNRIVVTVESTMQERTTAYVVCGAENKTRGGKILMNEKLVFLGHLEYDSSWFGFGKYKRIPENQSVILLLPNQPGDSNDGTRFMDDAFTFKCKLTINTLVMEEMQKNWKW
jgi:hypothetical protein